MRIPEKTKRRGVIRRLMRRTVSNQKSSYLERPDHFRLLLLGSNPNFKPDEFLSYDVKSNALERRRPQEAAKQLTVFDSTSAVPGSGPRRSVKYATEQALSRKHS